MCFSAEVSLLTYVIGILGSINLWYLQLYPEAIFYSWVIQMQLIEFILWNNNACNSINQITTKTGIIINHLEPVILWLAIVYFSNSQLPKFVHQYMILFLLITIIYTISVFNDNCTSVTNTSKPHLFWAWNNHSYASYYYALFLLALLLLSIYGLQNNGTTHALLVLLSFAVSHFIYKGKQTIGAMWCFMAAFAPVIIPFLYSESS